MVQIIVHVFVCVKLLQSLAPFSLLFAIHMYRFYPGLREGKWTFTFASPPIQCVWRAGLRTIQYNTCVASKFIPASAANQCLLLGLSVAVLDQGFSRSHSLSLPNHWVRSSISLALVTAGVLYLCATCCLWALGCSMDGAPAGQDQHNKLI